MRTGMESMPLWVKKGSMIQPFVASDTKTKVG
jgi:hypothetical protein